MMILFELINISFDWNNSKINIPFNVIQRVNTSMRISREFPGQLSYLKVINLDQYSLYSGWYTQVNERFQEYKTF